MKRIGVAFLVAFVSVVCVACGDLRDLDKSQMLDANDSQVESNIDSSTLRESLAWERADCDFLIKLWGITKESCDMLDSSPDIATIETKNIEQAYQQFLLDDDYWTLKIREFLLSELPMKNHTHTDKLTSEGVEKYITTYQWKDEKTLEIHIQHTDDCTDDYYTFFDLGDGKVKIMRNQETC